MSILYQNRDGCSMSGQGTNIYAMCRRQTGMTQEAWAEALGISVESVKRYETFVRVPSNYMVAQMVLESGDQQLAFRHLLNTSRDLDVLPQINDATLPTAAIQLINRVLKFTDANRDRQLLRIAEDGVISEEERPLYNEILADIQDLVAAAYQIRYCADERREGR